MSVPRSRMTARLRRAALAAGSLSAVVAVLAACGGSAGATSSAASAAGPSTTASASAVTSSSSASGAGGPAAQFTSGNGLTVQSVSQLDSRLYELALSSTAVPGTLMVRVLVPDGYAQDPSRHYPVVYLFPGTGDRAAYWTERGAAEATTAGRPVIAVMPDLGVDGDGGGYCTDWYNGGHGGQPMWETFEEGQLIPFIDRNLRTRANRAGRAIFGLSQGGFCALSLASRHPDTFVASGSFSGVIDMTGNPTSIIETNGEVQGTTKLDGVKDPNAMFGSRSAQEINWAAHDPATLVSNLRGMRVWAYTGNGKRGPFDPPSYGPGEAYNEIEVHSLTHQWAAAAHRAGVPVTLVDYGAGSHTWDYWKRDFQWVIGPLMKVFAHPPAAPAQKAFTSADDPWSQWGYTVSIARPAREFSTLTDGTAGGFTLAGSGTATVQTPAQYHAGASERVQLTGPHAKRTFVVRAGRDGRLRLRVPLGPGNRHQQDTAAARAAGGTKVYATRVTISRAR